MIVYRPKAPIGSAVHLQIGPGFYELEQLADRSGYIRWFAASGSFTAWHFGPEPGHYALRFDAVSFGGPRRLEVLLDGQSLGQWRVTDTQRFDIPLTLTVGHHAIELRALDPPISPASIGLAAQDTRPLAFAITNARLER